MEARDSRDLHPRKACQCCSFQFFQLIQRICGSLPEQALKNKLWNEEVGRLLVPADLSEGNSTRSVTVRLLDPGNPTGTTSSLGGYDLRTPHGRLMLGLLAPSRTSHVGGVPQLKLLLAGTSPVTLVSCRICSSYSWHHVRLAKHEC